VSSPIWGPDHIFVTVRQLRVCSCRAPSLTRERVSRLQLLLVLASAVVLGSEFRGTHDHILLSQIRDFPNLEGQVPVFIYPRNRVTQLRVYPQALGSLFVATYYSRGYGGGIRPRLHTGCLSADSSELLVHGPDRKRLFCRCRRNNVSTELFPNNGCFTVACLHSCFLTMGLHVDNTRMYIV
jgi:hypothetical protein